LATASQVLLLRGALEDAPEAASAAEEWFRTVGASSGPGFQGLEPASRRLLPLLYQNAKAHVSKDISDRLKPVYVEYWGKNQIHFQRAEKLLAWFEANAIPTLVLKGAALSFLHYRNTAVRPISDVDIMVREAEVARVIRTLHANGWNSEYMSSNVPDNSYFYSHIHAIAFTHLEQGDLDLHWHALQAATFPGADKGFWKDSVPLRLNNAATRALNPSDQLLHACVHGFTGDVVAPIRWIADAVTILRSSEMDWNRILELARILQLSMPLWLTLSFVGQNFRVAIPPHVLEQLSFSRVAKSDQRYFRRVAGLDRGWRQMFAYNLERHRRARKDLHPIKRLAFLPSDLGSFAFYRLGKRMNRD